jgi:outer membrane lipoprotein carrier protein
MGIKYFKKIFFLLMVFASLTSYIFAKEPNDSVTITNVENYLNHFQTITAKFKQVTLEDNKVKTGVLYISKPGKIRFDYLEPKKITIVLNKDMVMHYDHELEEASHAKEDNFFFKLLSEKNVNLKNDIKKITTTGDLIQLYIAKRHNNVDTNVIVTFEKNPMVLKEVTFESQHQDSYHLYFTDIQYDKKIDEKLFSVQDPKFYSDPY